MGWDVGTINLSRVRSSAALTIAQRLIVISQEPALQFCNGIHFVVEVYQSRGTKGTKFNAHLVPGKLFFQREKRKMTKTYVECARFHKDGMRPAKRRKESLTVKGVRMLELGSLTSCIATTKIHERTDADADGPGLR